MDRILDKIKDDQLVLSYLPDQPKKHVTKKFLLAIVNSVDPTFCFRVQAEVDQIDRERYAAKAQAPATIEIDKEMLALIEQFDAFSLKGSRPKNFGSMMPNRPKKTRTQRSNMWEFNTRVDASQHRREIFLQQTPLSQRRPFHNPKH